MDYHGRQMPVFGLEDPDSDSVKGAGELRGVRPLRDVGSLLPIDENVHENGDVAG